MVAFAAIAVTLFYIAAIPVHIVFRLHTDANEPLWLGISIFESRFAHQNLLHRKKKRTPKKKLHTVDILFAVKTALRHIRIEYFHLNGTFGADDAAITALVCGGISALSCTWPGKAILHPDFSSDRLQIDLTGMISFRAGHIMIAALLGAFQYGFRRFKSWTSIPSKAL